MLCYTVGTVQGASPPALIRGLRGAGVAALANRRMGDEHMDERDEFTGALVRAATEVRGGSILAEDEWEDGEFPGDNLETYLRTVLAYLGIGWKLEWDLSPQPSSSTFSSSEYIDIGATCTPRRVSYKARFTLEERDKVPIYRLGSVTNR